MSQPCDHGFDGDTTSTLTRGRISRARQRAAGPVTCQAGTPAGGALADDVRGGTLPSIGLISPNLLHDGHNGTPAQADAWLRSWIPVLMSGPDWRSGGWPSSSSSMRASDRAGAIRAHGPGAYSAKVSKPRRSVRADPAHRQDHRRSPLRHASRRPTWRTSWGRSDRQCRSSFLCGTRAVPALGALLGSREESAEVVTLPAERAAMRPVSSIWKLARRTVAGFAVSRISTPPSRAARGSLPARPDRGGRLEPLLAAGLLASPRAAGWVPCLAAARFPAGRPWLGHPSR